MSDARGMAHRSPPAIPDDLRTRLEAARLELLALFRTLDRMSLSAGEIPQRLLQQLFETRCQLCGSPLGAGPAGWQLGPPRHAPRHARGSKPTAQSGGPVSEKTPVAFPTHLGPTGRESAKGPQPQGGLQHGARPRSRKRLSTPPAIPNTAKMPSMIFLVFSKLVTLSWSFSPRSWSLSFRS